MCPRPVEEYSLSGSHPISHVTAAWLSSMLRVGGTCRDEDKIPPPHTHTHHPLHPSPYLTPTPFECSQAVKGHRTTDSLRVVTGSILAEKTSWKDPSWASTNQSDLAGRWTREGIPGRGTVEPWPGGGATPGVFGGVLRSEAWCLILLSTVRRSSGWKPAHGGIGFSWRAGSGKWCGAGQGGLDGKGLDPVPQ